MNRSTRTTLSKEAKAQRKKARWEVAKKILTLSEGCLSHKERYRKVGEAINEAIIVMPWLTKKMINVRASNKSVGEVQSLKIK